MDRVGQAQARLDAQIAARKADAAMSVVTGGSLLAVTWAAMNVGGLMWLGFGIMFVVWIAQVRSYRRGILAVGRRKAVLVKELAREQVQLERKLEW